MSVVALTVWNAVPNNSSSLPTFKKNLVAIIQCRVHVTVSLHCLRIFTSWLYINLLLLLLVLLLPPPPTTSFYYYYSILANRYIVYYSHSHLLSFYVKTYEIV